MVNSLQEKVSFKSLTVLFGHFLQSQAFTHVKLVLSDHALKVPFYYPQLTGGCMAYHIRPGALMFLFYWPKLIQLE